MRAKTSILDEDLSRTDPRVKQILMKMKKENYRPDALIEILHTAQNSFGYLPMGVLAFITKELKVPPSRVYSTVTFYHFFSLKSKGEHTCLVCTGTACYVKGAEPILAELEKKYSLKAGQVRADNKLGISTARCIGACGLAPTAVVDGEVIPRAKPEDVINMLQQKMGADQ